jgi:hypothetical protein
VLLTVDFIAVVPTSRICECLIRASEEPCVIRLIIDVGVSAEAVGKTQIARIAACGVTTLKQCIVITRS